MAGYTVYITYQFEGTSFAEGVGHGYSTPIHCNYINKIETDSLSNSTVGFVFLDPEGFPFLKNPTDIAYGNDGFGWSAYKINALVQILDFTGTTAIPDPAMWKKIDITNQVVDWVSGQSLTVTGLTSSLFVINLVDYTNAPYYDLTYLNYPTALSADDNRLAWGEESFFFGNVKTDIKAIAYTTDISILMPLNQFNSTTNITWDQNSPVLLSEIGIYDEDNNLVGIGKLNNPISKDSTVSRTIIFEIDF